MCMCEFFCCDCVKGGGDYSRFGACSGVRFLKTACEGYVWKVLVCLGFSLLFHNYNLPRFKNLDTWVQN